MNTSAPSHSIARIAKPFAVALALFGGALTAQAMPTQTDFAPKWSRVGKPRANESYLARTGLRAEHSINDDLFDPAVARTMRTEYENSVDADERRRNAGLVEAGEDKTRFAAMKDLARRAVDTVTQLRLRIEGDKLKKIAENSDSVVREPVAAVVLAASLYTGRSVNFKVFNHTRVSSRIVLKDRAGSLSLPLASTGITGAIAYNAGQPMTAQLSRELMTNVSAVVDSGQRGSAQVVYSVSF